MSLVAAIGIVYKKSGIGFLMAASENNPSSLSKVSANQFEEIIHVRYAIPYAVFNLTWTTIFAVKFSFLAFFKKLIDRMTKIHTYYWIVVAVTLLSWLFMMVEPLIMCKSANTTISRMHSRPSRSQAY